MMAERYSNFLQRMLFPFLLHPTIRFVFLRARLFYFVALKRRLQSYESGSQTIKTNTVSYNLSMMRSTMVLHRTNLLIRSFASLEDVGVRSKILVIGPRTEDDLFHLKAYGFNHVRGFDLISYSPLIEVGDMHQLPYGDGSMDAVLIGWTLVYSNSPEIVLKEIARVLSPRGYIGIGSEYYPEKLHQELQSGSNSNQGYTFGGKRLNRVNDHEVLLAKEFETVFRHDLGDVYPEQKSNLCLIARKIG